LLITQRNVSMLCAAQYFSNALGFSIVIESFAASPGPTGFSIWQEEIKRASKRKFRRLNFMIGPT